MYDIVYFFSNFIIKIIYKQTFYNHILFNKSDILKIFTNHISYLDIVVSIYNNHTFLIDFMKFTTAYSTTHIPCDIQEFFDIFIDIKNVIYHHSIDNIIEIYIGIKNNINSEILLSKTVII